MPEIPEKIIRRRQRRVAQRRRLEKVGRDNTLAGAFRRLFLNEMERDGIRDRELALAYGSSVENISQLLAGDLDLKLETADKLCRAINRRLVLIIEPQLSTEGTDNEPRATEDLLGC